MEMLIGLLVMCAVPGYFILQWKLAVRFAGGWRKAALAPLIMMVPLYVYSLFELAQGSNLWPLMLILAAPFGFVYLGGLWWLHEERV